MHMYVQTDIGMTKSVQKSAVIPASIVTIANILQPFFSIHTYLKIGYHHELLCLYLRQHKHFFMLLNVLLKCILKSFTVFHCRNEQQSTKSLCWSVTVIVELIPLICSTRKFISQLIVFVFVLHFQPGCIRWTVSVFLRNISETTEQYGTRCQ